MIDRGTSSVKSEISENHNLSTITITTVVRERDVVDGGTGMEGGPLRGPDAKGN